MAEPVNWDHRFLELAKHVSEWSKDLGTKVGAVIVDDHRRVMGLGFNGFPRGVHDYLERLEDRDQKLRFTVHAEQNAILNAQKTEGCTLYVYPSFAYPFCCHECARFVIQAGIKRVVGWKPENPEKYQRWKESLDFAEKMFQEAGVIVDAI